jgi:hypothetical protein
MTATSKRIHEPGFRINNTCIILLTVYKCSLVSSITMLCVRRVIAQSTRNAMPKNAKGFCVLRRSKLTCVSVAVNAKADSSDDSDASSDGPLQVALSLAFSCVRCRKFTAQPGGRAKKPNMEDTLQKRVAALSSQVSCAAL